MTPLEQKVVNYELSKALVDNGIVLDTEFYWWRHDKTGEYSVDIYVQPSQVQGWKRLFPAPLLIEMLDKLPDEVSINKNVFDGIPNYSCKKLFIKEDFYEINPANAAAKMAIQLKQKGLLNI